MQVLRLRAPRRASLRMTNQKQLRMASDEGSVFHDAPEEGSAPRVAVEGCDQLDAVLRAAGGGAVQPGVRSDAGGFAADCGRDSVCGDDVCRGERAESGMGAGAAESGARCAADDAVAGGVAVSGQGAGEFSVCDGGGDSAGAAVCGVLQPARAGQCVAAGGGAATGDVVADREWSVFRGAVDSHEEPRAAAAADFVSDFYSGAAGDGDVGVGDPDRGRRSGAVDQNAGCLRCDLYYGVHDVV